MRPFNTEESSYEKSIAIDASNIGGITVTVAVSSERVDELAVLDSIYSAAEEYPFFPFRDKSHDLDHQESTDLFETVIDSNFDRLAATTHLGNDGSNPERVEAVQSAVLTEQMGAEDTLIILDGSEDKARRFGRAMSAIVDDLPPIATCIESEFYYPTSLLADLCASHLAYEIDHPRHCSEVTPSAPITKEEHNDSWGKAYAKMVNSSGAVPIEPIQQYRAETVSSRMNCWFNGQMGGGDPPPFESSVRPIVQHAREEGYDELAEQLSGI